MILLATLLFTACAPKSGFFSPDRLYQSALAHSQKGEIYNSLEMKASIVATYLNGTLEEYKKSPDEVFLIAIYIDEDLSDKSKQGIMNPSYRLTLNGEKPSAIRALAYDADLIKIAPFRNRWSDYYIIKFPKVSSEKLTLEYAHKNYGKATLSFLKD
jgi:hypothetical protein